PVWGDRRTVFHCCGSECAGGADGSSGSYARRAAKKIGRAPSAHMRVLLISSLYPPILGGAELQAQALARELNSRGVRMTVLTRPCPGEPMRDRDRAIT